MKILVACEESQVVCKAFRKKGHEAYSCDIQECSGGHPEWHIQGDVLSILKPQKQLPSKVKFLTGSNKNAGGYCPRCGQAVMINNTFAIKHRLKKGHYCEWCGQMLDWGEDPFKENNFFSKLKEYFKDSFYEDPFNTVIDFLIIIVFFIWIA